MAERANPNRMVKDFLELAVHDSVSFHERETADILKKKLTDLGFEVQEDGAGDIYGSGTGNLYGCLKGTAPGEPVLFSAHMDTVEPGIGKRPAVQGDRIVSDGTTVLGADDICGLVEILEGVRFTLESGEPYPDIEVLFTVAEELYGKGASQFDYSTLLSRQAYVLDMSGKPGVAARQAPSIISFDLTITGQEAHAGFAPQLGVNALKTAAAAIVRVDTGKVDVDTTVNIGTIEAGTADNIVPGLCRCTGEVRSFDHEKAESEVAKLHRIFLEEAKKTGAEVTFRSTVHIRAYETPANAGVCTRFQSACAALGLPGTLVSTHGGSDNNIFARHALEGIVLSCGMNRTHSTREYADIADMQTGAQLVAALVREGCAYV